MREKTISSELILKPHFKSCRRVQDHLLFRTMYSMPCHRFIFYVFYFVFSKVRKGWIWLIWTNRNIIIGTKKCLCAPYKTHQKGNFILRRNCSRTLPAVVPGIVFLLGQFSRFLFLLDQGLLTLPTWSTEFHSLTRLCMPDKVGHFPLFGKGACHSQHHHSFECHIIKLLLLWFASVFMNCVHYLVPHS